MFTDVLDVSVEVHHPHSMVVDNFICLKEDFFIRIASLKLRRISQIRINCLYTSLKVEKYEKSSNMITRRARSDIWKVYFCNQKSC